MGDYKDRCSRKYLDSIEDRVGKNIRKSFKDIVVVGIENIKKLPENSVILYAALHKSHMDYFASLFIFHTMNLPFPRTVTGTNLLTGWTGNVIKNATRTDMIKAGAIPIDRNKGPKQLKKLCGLLEDILTARNSTFVFPEHKEFDGTPKTGRTYIGKVREFAPALFQPAINTSNKTGRPVYVVSMDISYDFPPELFLFPKFIKNEPNLKSKDNLRKKWGEIYYSYLESRIFLYDLFNSGEGNIYIRFAEPIDVKDFAQRDVRDIVKRGDLALAAQQSAFDIAIATPFSILSYVLRGDKNPPSFSTQYSELLKQLEGNLGKKEPLGSPIMRYFSILNKFEDKGIIFTPSYESRNSKEIIVKRQDIINYYANTIEHLVK